MDEIRIDIDDIGIAFALDRLKGLTAGKAQPILAEIGRTLRTSTQLRFRDQRGPDGQAWAPSIRAAREGGQTLRDTGRLRNSITFEAGDREVAIGTNVVYAARHQFGYRAIATVPEHVRRITQAFGQPLRFPVFATVRVHSRVAFTPQRPFLGFSSQDRADIRDILAEHIERLSKG